MSDEPKYLVCFRNKGGGKDFHAHRLFATFEAARDNADLLSWYDTLEARVFKLEQVETSTKLESKIEARLKEQFKAQFGDESKPARRHAYDPVCQCSQCQAGREFAMKEAAV